MNPRVRIVAQVQLIVAEVADGSSTVGDMDPLYSARFARLNACLMHSGVSISETNMSPANFAVHILSLCRDSGFGRHAYLLPKVVNCGGDKT